MAGKRFMQISELAEKSGIPRYTIHYYLRIGLLHPPEKTGKTRAFYDNSHLERLRTIKSMKREFSSPLVFIKKQLDENGGLKPASLARQWPAFYRHGNTMSHDEKKQKIIDAAIELFATKGYRQTNVKDITDYLGISTGTFYLYFENKNELFLQVVDKVVRRTIEKVANAIREEKDLIKRAMLRTKAFSENYERYSEILSQLRAEAVMKGGWEEKRIKNIYLNLTKPLIREINQAIEQKIIRPVNPELMAFCFIGIVEILSFRGTMDDEYNSDQMFSFAFDLLMNGIMVRDQRPRKDL